jgi:hypothetical protein
MLDVADASVTKPVSTSPDTKAALGYLSASGGNAISITYSAGHVVIGVGYRADAVAAYWLPATLARSVAARARSIGGDAADVETVVAALKAAAVQLRVTLTPHDVAITRAHTMAARLDEFMSSMRGTGALKEFTRSYKRRRIEAAARGEGFMSYKIAEQRLRMAMIPVLMDGGQAVIGASIFATIFET